MILKQQVLTIPREALWRRLPVVANADPNVFDCQEAGPATQRPLVVRGSIGSVSWNRR